MFLFMWNYQVKYIYYLYQIINLVVQFLHQFIEEVTVDYSDIVIIIGGWLIDHNVTKNFLLEKSAPENTVFFKRNHMALANISQITI